MEIILKIIEGLVITMPICAVFVFINKRTSAKTIADLEKLKEEYLLEQEQEIYPLINVSKTEDIVMAKN